MINIVMFDDNPDDLTQVTRIISARVTGVEFKAVKVRSNHDVDANLIGITQQTILIVDGLMSETDVYYVLQKLKETGQTPVIIFSSGDDSCFNLDPYKSDFRIMDAPKYGDLLTSLPHVISIAEKYITGR